jgi:hypothetical protein
MTKMAYGSSWVYGHVAFVLIRNALIILGSEIRLPEESLDPALDPFSGVQTAHRLIQQAWP